MDNISKPICLVLLIAILLLASAIRFYRIGAEDLWLDEIYSLNRASVPFNQVTVGWDNYRVITHYAYDHLALRAWMLGGSSPAYLRTFSALCSILSVLLLFWISRLFFNREISLVSSLLLGLSSYHLYYSQEARAYALQVLCLLGMVYCLEKAFRTERNRWYGGHILLAIFAIYLQAFSIFCWAGILGWIIIRKYGLKENLSLSSILSSQGMIALAIIPYFIYLALPGGKAYLDWIPSPQPGILLATYNYYLAGKAWLIVPQLIRWGLILLSIGLLLMALPWWHKKGNEESTNSKELNGLGLGWCLFIIPVVLFYLTSFYKPIFIPDRYLIISLPFFYLLLAAGWGNISKPAVRYSVLVILIIGLCFTLNAHWHGHYKISWSKVMQKVEDTSQKETPIFIAPGYWETAMAHYQISPQLIIPVDSAQEFTDKSKKWRKARKEFLLVTVSDVMNNPDNSLAAAIPPSYSLATVHQETAPSQVCVLKATPAGSDKQGNKKATARN
jgi:uncharacterized membrane protein